MNYSLESHYRAYQLSCSEFAFSLGTLTGGPYAKRHWELSCKIENVDFVWGHRILAVLECIPLVGGLIALIERVCVFVHKRLNTPAKPNVPNEKSIVEKPKEDPVKVPLPAVSKDEITTQLLRDIPELNTWGLDEVQILALGLLYHAMNDKDHPAFMTEELNHKPDGSCNPIRSIKEQESYIKKVQIEISASEMLASYNKYKVIQLRPLQHADTLVLGCGNTPTHRHHYRSTNESHDHLQTDTVNIHMEMNPSVVSFWGYEPNDAFFKDKQEKYRLIVDEGPICAFLSIQNELDHFFRAARTSLRKGGYLALPTHVCTFPVPSDFVVSHNASIWQEARQQNVHPIILFQYTASKRVFAR